MCKDNAQWKGFPPSLLSETWILHLLIIDILSALLMEDFADMDTLSCLQPVTLSDQDILEMIFFPVVNEAKVARQSTQTILLMKLLVWFVLLYLLLTTRYNYYMFSIFNL